jgi:hypothetical protein
VICGKSQLDQFVFDANSVVSLKEKLSAFGGSPCTESSFKFTTNLLQTRARESLDDRDRFAKPSELQSDDDTSFATVKLL